MKTPEVRCLICDRPIPKARLQAIPGTVVCVDHSYVKPRSIHDTPVDSVDVDDLKDSMEQNDN